MLQAKTRADMPMTETMTATPLLNVDRVTLRYKTPNLLITATENVASPLASPIASSSSAPRAAENRRC